MKSETAVVSFVSLVKLAGGAGDLRFTVSLRTYCTMYVYAYMYCVQYVVSLAINESRQIMRLRAIIPRSPVVLVPVLRGLICTVVCTTPVIHTPLCKQYFAWTGTPVQFYSLMEYTYEHTHTAVVADSDKLSPTSFHIIAER